MCPVPKRSECLLFGLNFVLQQRGPHGLWCELSLNLGQHRGGVIASIHVGLGTNVGRKRHHIDTDIQQRRSMWAGPLAVGV